MAALALVRTAHRGKPEYRGSFMQIALALLQAPSAAVVFEATFVLTQLSQAPTAVRAVVGCYIGLLASQSDNNVKMIVLDRLGLLSPRHPDILREMLFDMLRVLQVTGGKDNIIFIIQKDFFQSILSLHPIIDFLFCLSTGRRRVSGWAVRSGRAVFIY